MSQFAAVATLTFAVLGFKVVALGLLAVTLALLLVGFVGGVDGASIPADPERDPAPPPAPTPTEQAERAREEAGRRDG